MAFSGYAPPPPSYANSMGGDPNTILTPSVPYIGSLPALRDGFMIHINGKVLPKANKFAVNLASGPTQQGCDIPLHINPRFAPTNKIVRNTFLSRSWGTEDRSGGFPFHPDQAFEMIILVTDTCYKIAINASHFCEYVHRTPKERVTHLQIDGDLVLHQIRFQHPFQAGQVPTASPFAPQPAAPAFVPPQPPTGPGYPQPPYNPAPVGGYPTGTASPPSGYPAAPPPQPYPQGYPPAPGFPGVPQPPQPPAGGYYPPQPPTVPAGAAGGYAPPPQPLVAMTLPHMQQLPGGISAGRVFKIHGMPKRNPNQFTINFKCRNQKNIPLHFNPRFREKVVVRNTMNSGSWGKEERSQPRFPFIPDQQFYITIIVEPERYKVSVNNQDFITYNHRIRNLANIHFLEIHGDIELYSLQY